MRRGKKILLWLAGIIVLVGLLVGTLPYWLGIVLPTILKRNHITYASYRATDYSHFELRDVNYSLNGTHFHAREVNGLTPILWWWNKEHHPEATFLNASNWSLSFVTNQTPQAPTSFPDAVTKTRAKVTSLRDWVGQSQLRDGLVEFHNQTIPVPTATWSNGNLSATVLVPHTNEIAKIEGHLGPNFPWTAAVTVPAQNLSVHVAMTNATTLGGFITWHTNHADIAAVFPRKGTLPEQALIEAKQFRITSQDIDLRGYSDVTGALRASWTNGTFTLDLRANATPLATSTNLEPFVATIAATGDTNEATVKTFNLTSPGMEARLSKPLSVTYTGEMLNRSATFVVKGDLSKQQFLPVSGLVSGTASLHRKPGTYPEVTFDVSGDHVTGFDIEAANIKTQGQLNWPLLQLQTLNARFVNGTVANISTDVDLEKRFVQRGKIEFSGKVGEDLLPIGYDYERLSLNAQFNGPLKHLNHSGELSLGEVVVPYLKTFRASAKWDGTGTDLKTFAAEMRVSKNALVRINGSADLKHSSNTKHVTAKLDQLTIVSGDQTFSLKTGVQLSADVTRTNKGSLWNAQISSMQLRSTRGDLMLEAALNGTAAGRFFIYGHRLESRLANAFLIRPIAEVRIGQVAAAADWNNGPAKWNIDLVAQYLQPMTNRMPVNLTNFSARVQMFGDEHGMTITNVTLSEQGQPVALASGMIPITINPARLSSGFTNVFQAHDQEPIHLRAITQKNVPFWEAITQRLPISIQNPSLDLSIDGTLARPRGTVRCEIPAGSIKLLTNSIRLGLSNFKADIAIDRHQIDLRQLSVLVEGQPLSATGTLPVPADLARDWRKVFNWRNATLTVRASDVQIAAFANLDRRFLSPQGMVSAKLNVNRGQISGGIIVVNAATRPIAQFGAVRDINARLHFAHNRLEIEQCAGTLGGGPIAVFGWADITHIHPKTGLPQFELNFRGDSVPVARRADLIVRAKFDLVAANTNKGPGIVSGDVGLQNSYILNDLKLLVPPHVAKPQNRPPYFSVQEQPFSSWKLDVKVKGDQFLKVRSPFFNGTCSANMHLGGTLAEPVALGDATINSGEVEFPFANVKVTQGFVTLTAAHPYMPYLFVTGSTKAYDFDIRMNVTGPVDNPKIEFTSTPGLPSEQILVMITTGELPATATALTAQQRTLKVGAFVGKNILSKFGLGSGSDQRLTMQSSRDLTEQNTETYSAEYKVNPDWSIIGDYNQFGGLNLGLKWRFYSK